MTRSIERIEIAIEHGGLQLGKLVARGRPDTAQGDGSLDGNPQLLRDGEFPLGCFGIADDKRFLESDFGEELAVRTASFASRSLNHDATTSDDKSSPCAGQTADKLTTTASNAIAE